VLIRELAEDHGGRRSMSQGDNRSLDQIRREAEGTRAALLASASELRETVSDSATDIKNRIRPEAIKAEVSSYIKSRGQQLLEDMTETARRNPVQAVAVGACIAYPALRLARAIPLPVWLIGAGLFLTSSSTGRELTRKATERTEDVADEARRRAHDLGDQIADIASDTKAKVAGALSGTTRTISDLADELRRTGSEAADAIGTRVSDGLHVAERSTTSAADAIASQSNATKDRLSQVGAMAEDAVSGASEFVQNAGSRAGQVGQDTFDWARNRATGLSERAGASFQEIFQQNPLLVAGAGLLIGGLIASVLPKSEMEESLIGETSDMAKSRVAEAAAAGFEAAKRATGVILSNVERQASAEGLTPDGLEQSAREIGQKVRHVAETAVTTAFDPNNEQNDNITQETAEK
jgi:hypothetical protein